MLRGGGEQRGGSGGVPWICYVNLLQRQHHRPRHRVGDAEAAAQILQRVAERIERLDHGRARRRDGLEAVPFGDDAIALLAGLDDVDVAQAGPFGGNVLVGVEEVLVAALLYLETHRVEGGHGGLLRVVLRGLAHDDRKAARRQGRAVGWRRGVSGRPSAGQRGDALDLDQHFRIGQLRDNAGGARRIRRRAEGLGIKRVHGRDVGRARQQDVDLDEMRGVGAGIFQDALDRGGDKAELRGEIIGQLAGVVEAWNAGDEQQIADAGSVGERWGFDVGGGGKWVRGMEAPARVGRISAA